MQEERIYSVLEQNHGIFRLIPTFVPRRFGRPGRRLRLHPDDYYCLGTKRGAIKERWFSSVISCMNGEEAPADEGLSYVSCSDDPRDRFSLREAVQTLQDVLIGPALMNQYGTWPMYSKFFDYQDALFHHVHLDFEAAARVGRLGKPEAYYYPPQYNNYPGNFPHTYFGFDPDVTKAQVLACLRDFEARDTRITELSRAYRIELGSGWYTPPGVIHAPGSYLTYEPQWNSDVNSVYENIAANEVYPLSFLNENCPTDHQADMEYILSLLDWEKNVEPHYKRRFSRPPVVRRETNSMAERWIAYGNEYIAATELTVFPGCSVVVQDSFAYGCILVQGMGTLGDYKCAAAGLLRYGQLSQDEYFVGIQAAQAGVQICNHSQYEPLVMLKHFPANAETPMADVS